MDQETREATLGSNVMVVALVLLSIVTIVVIYLCVGAWVISIINETFNDPLDPNREWGIICLLIAVWLPFIICYGLCRLFMFGFKGLFKDLFQSRI